MQSRSYLILTAVQAEADAIGAALRATSNFDALIVRVIGIRAVRLPIDISPKEIRGIILAGFAGALDSDLKIGDVVIDTATSEPIHIPGCRTGRIKTATYIVSTPAEKRSLHLSCGAMAVDMEGAIVKRFAEKMEVPFLHIRAISDTSADGIDPALLTFVDEIGRVRIWPLARGLVRKPSRLIQLVKLGIRSHRAGKKLGAAVTRLLSNKPFAPIGRF